MWIGCNEYVIVYRMCAWVLLSCTDCHAKQTESLELHPSTRAHSFSSHTGGLLSTTSCPHGGGRSVESRDNSGEEERIEEENCMSFVSDSESLSVYPESVILPTHQKYESQHHPPQHQEQHQGQHRHHSSFQSPSQPLYNISIHSSQACHQPSNQPQAHTSLKLQINLLRAELYSGKTSWLCFNLASFPGTRKIGGSVWYTLFVHARLPRFFWGTSKIP